MIVQRTIKNTLFCDNVLTIFKFSQGESANSSEGFFPVFV